MESPGQSGRFNPGQLEIVSLAPNRGRFPARGVPVPLTRLPGVLAGGHHADHRVERVEGYDAGRRVGGPADRRADPDAAAGCRDSAGGPAGPGREWRAPADAVRADAVDD